MTDIEQKKAATEFSTYWQGKGYEKGESQSFWMSLLTDVLGVSHAEQYIKFEDQVKLDNTSFIDGYISETNVLIEQKSIGKNLKQPIKQSDGSLLSPFQQAKRYSAELPYSKRPRWIVTCNFEEFNIYDMEQPSGEPEIIFLKDLPKEYYRLQFLISKENEHIKKEMEISLQAGEIVGELYDELLKLYIDPSNEETLKSLNMFCVRLVFCLYAEDAGIFGKHGKFHDYLNVFAAKDIRRALIDLFKVLNTKIEERDPYLDESLSSFPYVNGGLFENENIEIPQINDHIKHLILKNASEDFDWSEISPTIFGAVFESTLNPETRRSGGMHYTSIENIHKVIDPLFLDDLRKEFETISAVTVDKTRNKQLEEFQSKLEKLAFLDPACGSGNFLTETYLSLRTLENEVLSKLLKAQVMLFDIGNVIKVSIKQFYGIEINDFAVTVARTALWIAESQMMKKTEEIMQMHIDFLPLKSYAHIVEGNALRMDWEKVLPKSELHYIMGNPPFVGARLMDQGSPQKQEVEQIFGNIKDVQDLDYVCCWYKKAAEYIQGTNINVAFVSTNSICQGSQVPILWHVLLNEYKMYITFAHQTFKWESEASKKAAVHCVIVGFSRSPKEEKKLFTYNIGNSQAVMTKVKNISPYLLEGGNFFVTAQKKPLCSVPEMNFGSQPRDGGFFILTPEERDEILKKEPVLEKVIKPYVGAEEFIKGKKRYCIWLHNEPFDVIKNSKILKTRIEAVEKFRLDSKAKTTNGYAKVPAIFAQIAHPYTNYLIVPRVSSERRVYVPIGFLDMNSIASDAVQIIPNATLYHFGVLTSNVHMAWMRTVAGRLKSDYRYSKELVYNTFPWAEISEEQKQKIETCAQAILDERNRHVSSSLADLYDPTLMKTTGLLKAHQNLDKEVMKAYGFSTKDTEAEIVAKLMEMYRKLVEG